MPPSGQFITRAWSLGDTGRARLAREREPSAIVIAKAGRTSRGIIEQCTDPCLAAGSVRVPVMATSPDDLSGADWSSLSVDTLRTMLRGLRLWRAAVEDLGVTTIVDAHRQEWTIWDVEAIYSVSQEILPTRQAQAIRMFLVDGMRERDVAIAMGIAPTNPIGMYVSDGLRTLIVGIKSGSILLGHRGALGS